MEFSTQPIEMTGSARSSLIAISVLWALFAATVFLRFVGRIRGPGIGADDILSLAALILSGSTIGLNSAVFTTGVGHNFDPKSPVFPKLTHNLPFIMQITFSFTLIYIWCLASLKMSQLVLYQRVFRHQLRVWVYAFGTIIVAWALTFNFLFIFLCDPISQQWTIERTGHCIDQILLLKCLIMTNLVTDLLVVLLPIRSVWRLQMRKTEKVTVLACFGLGFACVIISLARFIQIYVIDLIGNLTGTSLTTFMLCTVELMLAGLCINIPMLRPFYLQWRSNQKSSQSSSMGLGSSSKISRNGHMRPGHSISGHKKAWFELDDKEQSTVTIIHDGSSSERELYDKRTDDAIYVSRQVEIART